MNDAEDAASAPEIYASFKITAQPGAFDPAEVSALFGIGSAQERRADDRLRSGKERGFTSWHFSTQVEKGYNWSSHLIQILELIEGRVDALKAFRKGHDVRLTIELVSYMDAGTPDGAIGKDLIRRIADLECDLDIDLYCGRVSVKRTGEPQVDRLRRQGR